MSLQIVLLEKKSDVSETVLSPVFMVEWNSKPTYSVVLIKYSKSISYPPNSKTKLLSVDSYITLILISKPKKECFKAEDDFTCITS